MLSADTQRAHTTTPSCDVQPADPVLRQIAEQHAAALERVQELLTARGIHARCVERFDITARMGGEEPLVQTRRHPPQLLVFADGGRRMATISVAPSSGAYVVELAQWGEDNEPRPDKATAIPENQPERVAALIPGYGEGAS
ncbi:hypothetical protein AB0H88_52265 [Nonomuraea sp. NPDC050680]|uniref:hypothetical protein n=1 Tax=Nonomuraea sp. NPDC050680 TaxID=3154630 RepID=UPI0033C441ED